MPLPDNRPKDALQGVLIMAGALVLAAFLGAAVGLVWQDTGDDEAEESEPAGDARVA